MIRIMVVDDQSLMREGLKIILNSSKDMEVVDTCKDGKEAIEKCNYKRPDVVLMDIRMPVLNGVEAVKEIKKVNKNVKIIMLTTFDDEEYIVEAMGYGACGYLLKDIEAENLIDAIKDAFNDKMIMPTKVAQVLAQKALAIKEDKPKQEIYGLTERESEVAIMIAQGFTNKQIASALYISEGTVKNNVSTIYSKLEINDRTKLAVFLKENGIV